MTEKSVESQFEAAKAALEGAIEAAWKRYHEKQFADTSAGYQEGFADGLERAFLLVERSEDA